MSKIGLIGCVALSLVLSGCVAKQNVTEEADVVTPTPTMAQTEIQATPTGTVTKRSGEEIDKELDEVDLEIMNFGGNDFDTTGLGDDKIIDVK